MKFDTHYKNKKMSVNINVHCTSTYCAGFIVDELQVLVNHRPFFRSARALARGLPGADGGGSEGGGRVFETDELRQKKSRYARIFVRLSFSSLIRCFVFEASWNLNGVMTNAAC